MNAPMPLTAAVRAAQASDTVLAEMNLTRWAVTYHCSEEAIRAEWERQEWERTQQPKNTYEVEGK